MRRISERTLWFFSAFTLLALIVIAVATQHVTANYSDSNNWVSHTQHVQLTVQRVRVSILTAEFGRYEYVYANRQDGLQDYLDAANSLPGLLDQLRALTADNPAQQKLVADVTPLIERELSVLRVSTQMKSQGASITAQQEYSLTGGDLSRSILATLADLRAQEERLLSLRKIVSDERYRSQKTMLVIAFMVIFALTILSFIELILQLRERRAAEESIRRLSGRLLLIQDEERRKLARDLHDGIGQIFAVLRMSVDTAAATQPLPPVAASALATAQKLIDEGSNQSRTISHLLHPPMLDEVGFPAAVQWLVNGFAERSKTDVISNIPKDLQLPREIALTLFRILQEALANIHRHAGSPRAEVSVAATQDEVLMTVRDFGKGIPDDVLQKFRTGTSPGVGLAGMRGRVSDLNGTLELQARQEGTQVRVRIPLPGGLQELPTSRPPAPESAIGGADSPAKPARSSGSLDASTSVNAQPSPDIE